MSGYRQTSKAVIVFTIVLLATDLAGRSEGHGVQIGAGAKVGTVVNVNVQAAKGRHICRNYHHVISNFTNGVFFCPDRGDPGDYTYCCGEYGNQRCCGYYDNPVRAGLAIFGYIILGLFVLVPLVAFLGVPLILCLSWIKDKIHNSCTA